MRYRKVGWPGGDGGGGVRQGDSECRVTRFEDWVTGGKPSCLALKEARCYIQ